MNWIRIYLFVLLISSLSGRDDFFAKNLSEEEVEQRIGKFFLEHITNPEEPAAEEVLTALAKLWKSSEKVDFSKKLDVISEQEINNFLEVIDKKISSSALEEKEYEGIVQADEIKAFLTAERIRTVVFSFSSDFGEKKQVFIKYTEERLKDSNITFEDVINAHTLSTFAGTGRPRTDPKQGEWMLFYDSVNPIYRLVALKNILKSWNNDYDDNDSELPISYLRALVSRKFYLETITKDPLEFIANKAHDELKAVNLEIQKIEEETELVASEIKVSLEISGKEHKKDKILKERKTGSAVVGKETFLNKTQITQNESEEQGNGKSLLWVIAGVSFLGIISFILKGKIKS